MFENRIARYKEEGCSIVYIDKNGFAHDMPITHGYSIVVDRCYATQDWNTKGAYKCNIWLGWRFTN